MEWTGPRRRALARRLLRWFDAEQRDMPWRATRDPWAILVSEVILQQTRVETGTRHYRAFLARFPTPAALARADDDALLKAWEGLGYYRRARNLRAAAQAMVAEHRGKVPDDHAALLALPGVGPYTAGAVASIAFGLPEPCVDGNAARVLARLSAYRRDASTAAARRDFEALARSLLGARPGALNQALMELGSQVCKPRAPRCAECPVARFCAAKARRLQGRLPNLPDKPRPRTVRVAVLLVESAGRVLLAQNPDGGLLAGQWTLPILETKGRRGVDAARAWLTRTVGATATAADDVGPFRHAFSHRTWVGRVLRVMAPAGPRTPAGAAWVNPDRWSALPLTTATRRLLERYWAAPSVTVI